MTGKLSKNFHGVGIGPLSKILAVKGSAAGQNKLTFVYKFFIIVDSKYLVQNCQEYAYIICESFPNIKLTCNNILEDTFK